MEREVDGISGLVQRFADLVCCSEEGAKALQLLVSLCFNTHL